MEKYLVSLSINKYPDGAYISIYYIRIYIFIYKHILLHSRLSIIIEHICVSCGYDSNFIAHDNTSVNLVEKKFAFRLYSIVTYV